MKLFKEILDLNGRLDRKGYLLLAILPIIGLIFLFSSYSFYSEPMMLIWSILSILVFVLVMVSSVKRGRDSGLNGLVTLSIFISVPIIVSVFSELVEIDISYTVFSFIAYLLLLPSTSKELKSIGKIESVFTITLMALAPFLIVTAGIMIPKIFT